ncbi:MULTISPECIES: ABC transporter substrate-binding protein [Haloferacaceae]|uniref:ABC transporter substrate-binding protein n=1 Tax=Halorubrum glutamatedens TaxID=2707018 RepID=A0ABD5QRA5_9EURY|nr:ABC transporter substrate-binding protein [Halobellus captivus]
MPKLDRRKFVQAGAGSLLATAMAGCMDSGNGDTGDGEATDDGETPETPETEGDAFRIAWSSGINNVHPLGWLNIADFDTVRMIYEPLVSVNDQAQAIPHLADWEVNEDATEYTWNLRDDVTWHDGEPLTAEDVAYTFKLIREYTWPYLGFLSDVLGDPEDYTVEEHTLVTPLQGPFSALPLALADLGLIAPKHIWEDIDEPADTNNLDNPIGSGPFQLENREESQFLQYSVNEDYWGDSPAYDEVIVEIIGETDTQMLSLQQGDIDMTRIDAGSQVDQIDESENLDLIEAGSTFIHYLSFQTEREPFDDLAVRRAIATAIDRQQLIDLVMAGYATQASSILTSGLEYFHNPDVPTYDYDPGEAEAILDENGYELQGDTRVTPDGEEMSYDLTISNVDVWPRLADVIQTQLGEIGIDITVDNVEPGTYTDRVQVEHDYEITISNWRLWFDPDPFLAPSFEDEGVQNYSKYQNDDFIDAMQAQRRAVDDETRQEHLYEAQEIIAEDIPWYPLYYPDLLHAVNNERWTNANPIPRYGMDSAYGHDTGTGPLLQLEEL